MTEDFHYWSSVMNASNKIISNKRRGEIFKT